MNTTDEYITSETDSGILDIIRNYGSGDHIESREFTGKNEVVWKTACVHTVSDLIQACDNGYVFRIKNPNYKPLPKVGEVWKTSANKKAFITRASQIDCIDVCYIERYGLLVNSRISRESLKEKIGEINLELLK